MDISFFFKQKTAYEMRMSDCSSDVCSSDRAVQDRAPDIFRAVAVIGTSHALEHTGLALDIGSHGIGLGDAERDIAGGERLEHGSRQLDRKSVGSGKSVSVRLVIGGSRSTNKNKNIYNQISTTLMSL